MIPRFLSLLGLLCTGNLFAGTIPYEVVALDVSKQTLVEIDMDTGEQVITPIPEEYPGGNVLATNTSGSVFLVHGAYEVANEPVGTLLEFNTRTEQWHATDIGTSVEEPNDMEFTPDGNLVVPGEFGVGKLDPRTAKWSNGFKTALHEYIFVEVDSIGSIITASPGSQRRFVRERPGVAEADIIPMESGFLLGDYVLETDDTLIASGWRDGKLHRISLDTGLAEVIYEYEGAPIVQIKLDPEGRVIASRATPDWKISGELTRFDLAMGTEETIILDNDLRPHDFDLLSLPETLLLAGDADQDLDFDQFDLIQVQQAAKYLTGRPATWGEGDWNGAPGGEPGIPPDGDGVFDQLDIVLAQQGAHYNTGPYAALQPNGQTGDGQTSVIYNATTGEVAVDAPSGVELTSMNIDSAAGIFTGDPAQNLGGSFDHDADDNIFKATFGSSFGSLSFGHVAQPGLSKEFLAGDLTVVGSLAGGGDLGDVDLVYVPEPPAILVALIGLLGIGLCYRR